jgi:hypothetical protein
MVAIHRLEPEANGSVPIGVFQMILERCEAGALVIPAQPFAQRDSYADSYAGGKGGTKRPAAV